MEAVINISKFDTNHTADVRWRRRSHSSGEEVNDFSGGGEIEVGNYERSLENNMVELPWGRSLSTVITVSLVGEHLRTPLIWILIPPSVVVFLSLSRSFNKEQCRTLYATTNLLSFIRSGNEADSS